MKFKLSTNKLVNIIVLGIALFFGASFALFYWSVSGTYTGIDPEFNNRIIDTLKPIDSAVSGELSYYKYVSKRDSIKFLRDYKNENINAGGGFMFDNVVQVSGGYICCDICTMKGYWSIALSKNKSFPIQYFLKLPAWKLKSSANGNFYNDSVRFYMVHNRAYVRKVASEKSVINKNGTTYSYRRVIDVPVKFGYDQRTQSLMIPVSKSIRNIANIVTAIFTLAFITGILYLFGVFLKFIIDLSKGFAFIPENVGRLKVIAFSLLIYPILVLLLALLMKLLFYSYFISDVIFNNAVWIGFWKPLVAGVIFFLLYKAFKQGKLLKDEQDLTV